MRDEEIVELYWARNEEAIGQTRQKYEPYLMKIAGNILADRQDSEECVNDTYLKTWNAVPKAKPTVLSGFLGRIARGLAIDRYRKNHAQKRYASEYALSLSELDETFSDGATPEEQLCAGALREAIERFLQEQTKLARRIFIGRYYFFDPVQEIAGYCGVPVGTVKSSLHRTRQALRSYLIKEGFEL